MLPLLNQVTMSMVVNAQLCMMMPVMAVVLVVHVIGRGPSSVVILIRGTMILTECADAYQTTLNQVIWVVSSLSASMEEHTSQTLRCSTKANSILQTCSEDRWSMMWI